MDEKQLINIFKTIVVWVVPISALLISVITLYLAYLRGPNIYLAIPKKKYPCFKVIPNYLIDHSYFYGLKTRLLIVNLGLRPGILFDFNLHHSDEIGSFEMEPSPEEFLPISISPGEGIPIVLEIYINMDANYLQDKTLKKEVVIIQAKYFVSASFGRMLRKKAKVNIDLEPVYTYLEECKEHQP